MYKTKKTRHTIAPQSTKMIVLMVMFIFLIAFLPLVSSAPPFATTPLTSTTSLQIESPNLPVQQAGVEKRFHAHVINQTSSKTNKTTSCALHVYNITGWDMATGTQWMEFESYNGIDFAMTVGGKNFTKSGTYAYVIQCNSSNEIGFYRGQFQVTPNGEVADVGTAIFYVGLLAVLLFFLALSIFSFTQFENLTNRVGMVGIGYLLLMAITFIGWNMAQDFLTSSPFLIEMLRILFFVFIIGFFPLVIGGFIWYFLMLWKIKEIERLMTKGFSEDDAKRRVR